MARALDEIRCLFADGTLAGLSDGDLLERFAARGDGEAFAEIMRRHGATVLYACRASLGPHNVADAEDAFQATFLVLVRRAGSFPVRGTLAGWLHRVAGRVARQARIEASRRRAREQVAAGRRETEPPGDPSREEIRRLVRQELDRLPERYRTPILLCDLQGFTRDQAAVAIGCPPGTVAGRLARARERLRRRLSSRGVDAPSAWTTALPTLADELSGFLRRMTDAAILAAREGEANGMAGRLAEKATQGLLATSPAAIFPLVIILGTVGAAAAVLAEWHDWDEPPATASIAASRISRSGDGPPPAIDPDDPATADLFAGRVVDAEGRPVGGAKVYIVPRNDRPRGASPTGPGTVRAVTAADGRFRFSAKDMTFPSIDGLPARRPGLLIAVAVGYGPDWMTTWGQTGSSFVSHGDPLKGADLTLRLARDDVPIRGRLIGPDSRPLAGASVRLISLDVPRGRDLDFHLKKWASSASLPAATFDPERTIVGPALPPGLTTEVVTDGDGRFRLDGLGRDRLARLSIRSPGVVTTRVTVMTRLAEDVRRPNWGEDPVIHGAQLTLSLERGRAVRGVVRDKVSGKPIADAWIGPDIDPIVALFTNSYPDVTDNRGQFVLDGFSPTLAELTREVSVGIGKTERQRIVLALPKPGQPHFLATGRVDDRGDAVVECPRGIPFRLTLLDEAGRPVEAEVTYSAIMPNERRRDWVEFIASQSGAPLSRAARRADGSYQGVALPGPGAVLVTTPRAAAYRPAHVNPKAFFAPGKTDWTAQELITSYGSEDTLIIGEGGVWLDQQDYSAIVLVNPAEGPGPLELTATVVRDRPRQVTLLDPVGRPVVGATSNGLTSHPWDREPRLRSATFPIIGLHPDRARRIRFEKEEARLIGFLMARGDGDSPYVVRMQPWATVTGRVLGRDGKPAARVAVDAGTEREFAAHDDPTAGVFPEGATDDEGRFRVERLIPGLTYTATVYAGAAQDHWPAFQDLRLIPGEVRDLGDIRPPASDGLGLH